MAEETEEKTEEEKQEETDIFYVQQQMLDTLTDLFTKQDQQLPPQPVYVSPSAPLPKAPNYLLYIGIGLGVLLLTGRLKL